MTTLLASPNPLIYPAQVHLVATVAPAPTSSGGFLPGVGFYIDGVFSQPSPLDEAGTGTVDLSLSPGTYSLTAVFGGLGDYAASTSAPVSEVVIQKPAPATETGSPALQASSGMPGEAGTWQTQAANPTLAVGPSEIVQMTEHGMRWWDRDGTPLFHAGLGDFFFLEPASQFGSPRGPRAHYDAIHGRWLFVQVTRDSFAPGSGHLYIAITDTSSAAGGYWLYRFDLSNESPRNPAIGVSSDKVAVGFDVDDLNTDVFKGSTVLVLNWADLLAHPSTIAFSRSIPNPDHHLWRPALGLTAGNPLFAVASGSSSNPAHSLEMTVTGTVTGPGTGVTFSVSDLTTGPTNLPDTGTNGLTGGPSSALWSSNHLWFTGTRTCLPTGDIFSASCVRITELSTSGALTVVQDFVIATHDMHTYAGGIGLAGDGSLIIVYSQLMNPGPVGGLHDPFSTFATAQLPGDPVNTIRPSQLIDAGVTWCLNGPECLSSAGGKSNYTAVPADPNDSHAVWESAVTSRVGGWRTWLSRLQTATGPAGGTMTIAEGRPATNSLRVGLEMDPDSASRVTQALLSNSPTTSGGVLTAGIASPVAFRLPWSLADPSAGGSSSTGSRAVFIQWGDGRGNWSAVESASITVDAPLGASLVPLNPVRLLDSRTGIGLSGRFTSRLARSFQVTGRGGVPANAVAVTGNLTVVGQTASGYVFLGPAAVNNPTSSTLNFPRGDIRANGVTVMLGAGGKLGATYVAGVAGSTADVIFDVTGYLLEDDPTDPIGGTWVALDPVRALDTRDGTGLSGRYYHRNPRTFCITGCVPVPDDAVAVTGNLTVTGQTTAGYVSLGPVFTNAPNSSSLNFPVKDTRANNVTVRLDEFGNLTAVFVGTNPAASTNLIFDVTGYFVSGPWGATFIPLNPTRILDTRVGNGLSGPFVHRMPRSLGAAGVGGIPATATQGIIGNLTVTGQTTNGYAFVGPTATSTPASSTLNLPLGDTRANGADFGLAGDGTFGIVWVGTVVSSTAAAIFDVAGYFR